MKKLVDYLPLLTICLLYFGFCNLYFYYKDFKIDIYDYISSSEILLSFFPTVVLATSLTYGIIYQTVLNASEDRKQTTSDNPQTEIKKSEKKTSKFFNALFTSPSFALSIFVLVKIAVYAILYSLFHIKDYNLQYFNVIAALLFFVIFYFHLKSNNKLHIVESNLFLFSIFLMIYIGSEINTYRHLDAQKIKAGISEKKISFKYNDRLISTSDSLLYIGETQSNLFLYNLKDSSAIVYKVSNLDSLSIK